MESGKSGACVGKSAHYFHSCEGPSKEKEKRSRLEKERLQTLGLHKVVIIALNKREGYNENEFDC